MLKKGTSECVNRFLPEDQEPEDETYRLVFTLRQVPAISKDKGLVTLDNYACIPWSKRWESLTMEEIDAANVISNNQFLPVDSLSKEFRNMVSVMSMRKRFNNDIYGPYVMSCDYPLDRDMFEEVISRWGKDRLNELEKESRL